MLHAAECGGDAQIRKAVMDAVFPIRAERPSRL